MKRLLFVAVASLFWACKENDNHAVTAAESDSPMALAGAKAEDMAAPTEEVGMPPKPDAIQQKIIKDARLRFETDDLDATFSRISTSVKKYGALVQKDESGKEYNKLYRNVLVRVPSKHFDAFIAEVGNGVSYFETKEITARDVTEEYVDLSARLKTKKALEQRYLELLSKAAKVSDMLEIEEKLSGVREEIEAQQCRLKYLDSQVSMSTVDIGFYKFTTADGGATVSYGSKMWNAVKSGFFGISTFFLGLLYIWPVLLILGVLIFWIRRKLKNRKKTV
jgi:hypothetical protein